MTELVAVKAAPRMIRPFSCMLGFHKLELTPGAGCWSARCTCCSHQPALSESELADLLDGDS